VAAILHVPEGKWPLGIREETDSNFFCSTTCARSAILFASVYKLSTLQYTKSKLISLFPVLFFWLSSEGLHP
jgi:hypothetical protein